MMMCPCSSVDTHFVGILLPSQSAWCLCCRPGGVDVKSAKKDGKFFSAFLPTGNKNCVAKYSQITAISNMIIQKTSQPHNIVVYCVTDGERYGRKVAWRAKKKKKKKIKETPSTVVVVMVRCHCC
jgi:hypothetical protein